MSTTFMNRAKVALTAVVATIALAIGMTALAPSNAQAITTSNGANVIDLSFQESTTVKGHEYSLAYDWSQAAPGNSHAGNWNVYLMIDDDVQDNPMFFIVQNIDTKAIVLNQIKDYDYQAIILKNGTALLYRSDEDSFEAFVANDPKERQVSFPGLYCAANDGSSGDIYEVDGNDLRVRYYRVGDTTFKSTNNGRDVTYTYRYKINTSSTGSYFKRSSSICTPLSTTKWRTLASKKTAYKSSTSKTKKFSIKAGSKVQVKKIYTTSTKCRYYVKTKSGKYGWITGKKLVEDEA